MRYELSLGSNVADAPSRISSALEALRHFGEIVAVSSSYVTPPVSGIGPDYTNAVAVIESALGVEELNARLKQIERDAGRSPADKATGRVVIDLDIVIAGDQVLRPVDHSREYFLRGHREIQK